MLGKIISRKFAQLAEDSARYGPIKEAFYGLYRTTPCMPIMLRYAWHDAGTYDKATNTGGANASI
jgi:L-ascorbate peroxidase